MIKSKHFDIREYVPPETYLARGEKAWMLIDPRLIVVMDVIREELKAAITINDWMWGGDRLWSGLRLAGSPYYSGYSQHTFGRATDFLVKGYTANEVRAIIVRLFKQGKLPVKGLRLELKVSWVHLDLANVVGIVLFNP